MSNSTPICSTKDHVQVQERRGHSELILVEDWTRSSVIQRRMLSSKTLTPLKFRSGEHCTSLVSRTAPAEAISFLLNSYTGSSHTIRRMHLLETRRQHSLDRGCTSRGHSKAN